MNVTPENRNNTTRIAVFIDFDNVEIGVKNTLGAQFDIGVVLEAIKEHGDIVTKIAYSDWKRAGDYSRVLTQHAIRMVQRNVTPGGDKNGADITMALDALELAFTHDHINTFVIVGGDSDFISLVEKLKQYGRKVIVVGGRQFTSATMQKNCHEFIAYENLAGATRSARPAARGARPVAGTTPIADALPLVRRALKVLSDREATPQLGLLKSTLLQLDSTFSEREYGASTFRDFMEKAAEAGAVTLRHAGRSIVVESREDALQDVAVAPEPERVEPHPPQVPQAPAPADIDADEEETLPPSPMTMQDGIRAVQTAFGGSATAPRWPMYVRQAKQFLRSAIGGFDERNYGFASVVDLLRAAGKEGVLRVERDRHGAIRVFPGAKLARPAVEPVYGHTEPSVDLDGLPADPDIETESVVVPEFVVEPPIVEAEVTVAVSEDASDAGAPKRPARGRKTANRAPKTKSRAKSAKPRARKPRGKTAASDTGE